MIVPRFTFVKVHLTTSPAATRYVAVRVPVLPVELRVVAGDVRQVPARPRADSVTVYVPGVTDS